ncbi:hypothetical protein N7457_001204 [Penicillium paradoxum]|uniref:uncharacterized protein n=1 Tax=Penicillium paradoxum TaxID=176176 RepID=UPI0025482558|nr:uncharacterized protein N7457_001204 [Penicillium paradoxum]KAJ5794605.1 hypothetical protein N7457_001204 [Penicillium paradoxum]
MTSPRRSPRQAEKAAGTFGEDDQVGDEAPMSTSEVQVAVPIGREGIGKRRASDTEETEAGPSSKKQNTDDSEPNPLDEEALLADIKIDYSKTKSKTKAAKMPEKQIWGKVSAPIADREKAPRGWNPEEPDLMPEKVLDLDAQIKRCQERIKDNIMPHIYKSNLNDFLKEKKERDEKMAAEPGLSWPVVQRLEDLNLTLKALEKEEIGRDMFDTARAIIAEYRSGKMEWYEDLVTYWHGGVKLCEPRPFKWDEYRFMHD